jgi:cell division inhibitor SepF
MGFKDYFLSSKDDGATSKKNFAFESLRDSSTVSRAKMGMDLIEPKSFADVEKIINMFKTGHDVVVKLIDVSEPTFVRIMDLLCGAIYALDGSVARLDEKSQLYVFSLAKVNEH